MSDVLSEAELEVGQAQPLTALRDTELLQKMFDDTSSLHRQVSLLCSDVSWSLGSISHDELRAFIQSLEARSRNMLDDCTEFSRSISELQKRL